ncbi:hypothetical protein PR202_ga30323 [Eleusine coracana subsp. coracana]|uniref:Disease resistance protein At4g27190-like leucine-rich repeats domain-containing protein n=1 Tax=Eleusine coracana subsp. coracana TaxID=191504 RepID=A0AAV5DNL8_ELECO|nr:hypothetical protein PR202_ga30323 [Eleusine coracana subsp. coracana]
MAKLELLDLSGNVTIQALSSFSGTAGLKTLVLNGCVGLEHVGPLAPSLESFSFDVGYSISTNDSAKVSKISLAGCVDLKSFLLRGALQILEELNLSGTAIKKLDLNNQVVEVPRLKKVFLMGCNQLRVISWWKGSWKLEVLCIDTHGRRGAPNSVSSPFPPFQDKTHDGYVVAGDARFIQSLFDSNGGLKTKSLYLDLHVPHSISRSPSSSSNSVLAKPLCYSDDIVFRLESLSAYGNQIPWSPPSDLHVEIGEGIKLTDVPSSMRAPLEFALEWCRVERCLGLQAVFAASGSNECPYYFPKLEKFWASDLLAAHCIWSKGVIHDDSYSFGALQIIHVHNCPRIKFVLPFSSQITLPSLETLHITHCGDLRQVFPWDSSRLPEEYQKEVAVKEFPALKHIHLHDLPNLQEICAAKMYAPMLETVKLRGCWSLRRLPAVGRGQRPIADCEKECWERLRWEGLDTDHHPSLYQPHHSSYYKKRLLRGTVLR